MQSDTVQTEGLQEQCPSPEVWSATGSEAVYICDNGFDQDGAETRVCQSDGVWNGSILQCLPNLENQGTTHLCHSIIVQGQVKPLL